MSIKLLTNEKEDHIVEVNFRKFNLVTFPRVKYLRSGLPDPSLVFISSQSFVIDLHTKICRKLAKDSQGKHSAEMLVNYSRLWKFEGEDTFDDLQILLENNKNDFNKLPLSI